MAQVSSQTARPASPAHVDPRDAFLDEAAHQLRTPLSPLMMLAHLIGEDAQLPHSLRPHVALLRENVERAARLIDDLADYGRMRSGRLRIDVGEVDFASLVADVVERRREHAGERGVRLETALGADLPRLRGDGPRLRRAVDTLVCNGIVHAETSTAIAVRTRLVGGALALTVEDQGRGLAPAALATVFDVDAVGRPRLASHLGVGLALAHAVAELHGGSLVAHSDGPGRGATFTLRLPIAVR